MQDDSQRIKMQGVLADINQYEDGGELRTFSLHYIKKDGTRGFKAKVRKAGKVYKPGNGEEKSKFSYNLKQNGILLLENVETSQVFSLKIALLTRYNGIRIQH